MKKSILILALAFSGLLVGCKKDEVTPTPAPQSDCEKNSTYTQVITNYKDSSIQIEIDGVKNWNVDGGKNITIELKTGSHNLNYYYNNKKLNLVNFTISGYQSCSYEYFYINH